MTSVNEKFDPKHMVTVQGNRKYLRAQARILWFRNEHPDWGIEVDHPHVDLAEGVVISHARVKNPDGVIIGEGFKRVSHAEIAASKRGNAANWLEIGDTGAIVRALMCAGYLLEEDALEDEAGDEGAEGYGCEGLLPGGEPCTAELTSAQREYSLRKYNRPLCPDCQKRRDAAGSERSSEGSPGAGNKGGAGQDGGQAKPGGDASGVGEIPKERGGMIAFIRACWYRLALADRKEFGAGPAKWEVVLDLLNDSKIAAPKSNEGSEHKLMEAWLETAPDRDLRVYAEKIRDLLDEARLEQARGHGAV